MKKYLEVCISKVEGYLNPELSENNTFWPDLRDTLGDTMLEDLRSVSWGGMHGEWPCSFSENNSTHDGFCALKTKEPMT